MLVAVGLVFATPAGAVSRFAHPAGTGDIPCTDSDPTNACPLATALLISMTPDDITLLGDTYNVGAALTLNSGVTMHGEAGAPRPVINSTAGPSIIVNGGTIRDVTLNQTEGFFGPLNLTPGTAERVYVKTTAAVPTACLASAGSPPGAVVIRDSVCWNANPGGTGIAGNSSSGGDPLNLTLRNVTAVGQGAGSHGLAVGAGAAGFAQAFATNVIASGATGIEANVSGGATANILVDHSNYDTSDDDPGSGANVTPPGSPTNVLSPPAFVNAANGDFRQRTTSAGTVDLGTAAALPAPGLGPSDLDGGPRTLGAAPDIGAYEGTVFVPVPATPPPAASSVAAQPTSAATKKCRKGRKLKRGKCVKKKKKK